MRINRLQLTLAGFLCVTLAPAVAAQRPEIGFARRDSVVVAMPLASASEFRLGGFMGVEPRFAYEIDLDESGSVVTRDSSDNLVRSWRATGFPSTMRYIVEQVNTVRRPGGGRAVEVVLRSGTVAGRIFAPVGKEAAFRQVMASVEDADSVFRAGYLALGEVFFTGPLSSFTDAERTLILGWAHLTAGGSRVSSETYRGANYFVVEIPRDGNVWNNLVVRQNQRIGKVLTDRFAMLKAFARLSIPHESIGGVKLSTLSCHGTAPNYTDTRCDPVEIYFPLASLVRFAEDEITSQQLVNESVVRVSGDRIEIDLSNQ